MLEEKKELSDECLDYLKHMPDSCGVRMHESMQDKEEQITSLKEDVAILTDTLNGIEAAIKAGGSEEINCKEIRAQFKRINCFDYGEVRKMVLCTALKLREEDGGLSMEDAVKEAWKEVRDICKEE